MNPVQVTRQYPAIKRLLSGILFLVVSALPGNVSDSSAEKLLSREYRLKAAYLYNFAKFIEWPEETFPNKDTPMTLAVLGADPFGGHLSVIESRTIKGRKVRVQYFKSLKELEFCHLLFINAPDSEHLARAFNALKGLSVLTVGEMRGFSESGGMIQLLKRKNRIYFRINRAAAERSRLTISPILLKVAVQ